MSDRGYDDMGPRIDLGNDEELDDDLSSPHGMGSPPLGMSPAMGRPAGGGGGGGGTMLGLAALLLALAALGLSLLSFFSSPDPMPMSMDTPGIVPGGTAERVAKLEKDVSQVMLRMVTLEEEVKTLRRGASPINKLSELNAKVQALEERLGAMGSRPAPAPPAPAVRPQAQAQAQAPEPEARREDTRAKKSVYKVRKGDTLNAISERYGVSVQDMVRWNELRSPSSIMVGQDLVIYK